MYNMKFYAVKFGNPSGIFESWADCRAAVSGVKGAEYKSFSTRAEAESYLGGKDPVSDKLEADLGAGYAVAYTDGSYDKAGNRYSWGCVIFDIDGSETHLSGVGDNPEFTGSNNIPGEVFGVLTALNWAREKGRKKINICYDYAGLRHWAKGEWKTNTRIALFYAEECKKYSDIDILFTKIAGHSGNEYNDLADRLASDALK